LHAVAVSVLVVELQIEPPALLFYVVIGCCGEKERGKRPMMTKIAAEKSDVVMLTSDNPASEDPCMVLSISGYEIIM
jgi:UDP-N-acetylmuramyl tripeptide synthase